MMAKRSLCEEGTVHGHDGAEHHLIVPALRQTKLHLAVTVGASLRTENWYLCFDGDSQLWSLCALGIAWSTGN